MNKKEILSLRISLPFLSWVYDTAFTNYILSVPLHSLHRCFSYTGMLTMKVKKFGLIICKQPIVGHHLQFYPNTK